MNSAEERAADRAVCIGISAASHAIDEGLFKIFGVEELPERVLKGDQHPALKARIILWRSVGRLLDGVLQRRLDLELICPAEDLLVERLGRAARLDGVRDAHRKERVRL